MSQSSICASPPAVGGLNGGLPSYLQVLSAWRVVLCTTHGCCYTRQTLSRHLLEKHRLKRRERSLIEASSPLGSLAPTTRDVVYPPDGTDEIQGLPTVPGHLCHFDQCHYRTTNTDCIRQHYNQRHRWQVARQGAMPWHQAYFQTLFSQRQAVHYFAVVLSDAIPREGSPYISPHANAPHNAPGGSQSPKTADLEW